MHEAVERYIARVYGRKREPGAGQERGTPPGGETREGATGDTPDAAAVLEAYFRQTYGRERGRAGDGQG